MIISSSFVRQKSNLFKSQPDKLATNVVKRRNPEFHSVNLGVFSCWTNWRLSYMEMNKLSVCHINHYVSVYTGANICDNQECFLFNCSFSWQRAQQLYPMFTLKKTKPNPIIQLIRSPKFIDTQFLILMDSFVDQCQL